VDKAKLDGGFGVKRISLGFMICFFRGKKRRAKSKEQRGESEERRGEAPEISDVEW
jgi:hypothetical protein